VRKKECILKSLQIGSQTRLTMVVTDSMTAAIFADNEGETYANVLATPFLIANMERACAKILEPVLSDNEVSVGAHIDVRHLASTGVGGQFEVTAQLVEQKWGLYTFDVIASDDVGVIGKGRIIRAIANLQKIMERAELATS
jgi:fluoroacetyl-CoA thioesterase